MIFDGYFDKNYESSILRTYKLSRVALSKRFCGYKLSRTPNKFTKGLYLRKVFIPIKYHQLLEDISANLGKLQRIGTAGICRIFWDLPGSNPGGFLNNFGWNTIFTLPVLIFLEKSAPDKTRHFDKIWQNSRRVAYIKVMLKSEMFKTRQFDFSTFFNPWKISKSLLGDLSWRGASNRNIYHCLKGQTDCSTLIIFATYIRGSSGSQWIHVMPSNREFFAVIGDHHPT